MTKFLIVDGNSLAMRAYHAGKNDGHVLRSHEGIPTDIIVKFFNMLNKVMMQIEPTHIVICWDTDSHTFRKELYPEYKANRHKDDSVDFTDVYKQFGMIRNILDRLGIKSANVKGYEGDDIVGSFLYNSQADENYIVSGDQDAWALADENTTIIYPKSGFTDVALVTPDYIQEKLLIKKANYVGYKMLKGDVSDNLPGLTGCGPKTAAKLLDEFDNIDNIMSLNEDDLSNYNKKIRSNFKDWTNRAQLLKQLMTIRQDVDIPYSFDDCEIELLNWEEGKKYMKMLDMNNFIYRIECGAVYRLKW